jgi:hypothetical protein
MNGFLTTSTTVGLDSDEVPPVVAVADLKCDLTCSPKENPEGRVR